MSKVTSIRLNEDVCVQLDQLAAALDRPRAWVIEHAIARYVEEEAWQVAAIGEALAEYRDGGANLTPHDQVMADVADRLKAAGARPLA